MHLINITPALLLPVLASAVALPQTSPQTPFCPQIAIGDLKISQILHAAPKSANCTTISPECTNATIATPLINTAFQKYGTQTLGEKAALLSTMAFESGDFVYNTNQFPGRAGQGTKAMLMFPNIYAYAVAQPELKARVDALMPNSSSAAIANASNATMNAVRALVLPDQYTFGAAPWYLVNLCPGIPDVLNSANATGAFDTYITKCLNTTNTPERVGKWCTAVEAMIPVGMAMPNGC